MRVRVLCFGVLKELLGVEQQEIELEAGMSAGELIALVQGRASKQSEIWTRLAVAVNREYVGRQTVLRDGDEVALLPPVSGGSRGSVSAGPLSRGTRGSLSSASGGPLALLGRAGSQIARGGW